jgi:hypothetical protein
MGHGSEASGETKAVKKAIGEKRATGHVGCVDFRHFWKDSDIITVSARLSSATTVLYVNQAMPVMLWDAN